jgi:hypothetical protein
MTAEGLGPIPVTVELRVIVAVENEAVAMGEEARGSERKGKTMCAGRESKT